MLLEVKNLDAGYGFLQILRNVSLSVDRGEYVCLVGPNGAGKSTTLKSIAGLLRPMKGEIVFLIENIQIFTEFHPLLSWVRLSESEASLLNHEQVKFDLAELVKRENIVSLQDKFYNKHFPTRGQNEDQRKQYAKEDSGKMINKEVEKLQKLFDEKCLKYDDETNYGQNTDEQSRYDRLVKQIK